MVLVFLVKGSRYANLGHHLLSLCFKHLLSDPFYYFFFNKKVFYIALVVFLFIQYPFWNCHSNSYSWSFCSFSILIFNFLISFLGSIDSHFIFSCCCPLLLSVFIFLIQHTLKNFPNAHLRIFTLVWCIVL